MVDDDDTARDFVVNVLEHSEVDLVGNGDFEREDDMSEVGLQETRVQMKNAGCFNEERHLR